MSILSSAMMPCLFLLVQGDLNSTPDTPTNVVLQVERDAGNMLEDNYMDIIINDDEIGSLKPLDKGQYLFVPKANFKTEVYFVLGKRISKPSMTENILSNVPRISFIFATYEYLASANEYLTSAKVKKFKFEAKPGDIVSLKFKTDKTTGIVPVISVAHSVTHKPASVPSVVLDIKLKVVILKKSPAIRLARGTEKTVEDSLKVVHSITIVDTWKAELEIKGKVGLAWAEVETGIRGGIEKSEHRTYGVETERRRSVLLKGDGSPSKVKIVWVEYYRTGTATVIIDGREVKVPFEFKEDFDLLTEDAD